MGRSWDRTKRVEPTAQSALPEIEQMERRAHALRGNASMLRKQRSGKMADYQEALAMALDAGARASRDALQALGITAPPPESETAIAVSPAAIAAATPPADPPKKGAPTKGA